MYSNQPFFISRNLHIFIVNLIRLVNKIAISFWIIDNPRSQRLRKRAKYAKNQSDFCKQMLLNLNEKCLR